MRFFCFAYFLLVSCHAFSQEKNAFCISGNVNVGNILAHSKDIAHLASANPFGANLSIAWQSKRVMATESSPVRAKRGFRFAYTHFNNPIKLGHGYHLSAFTEPFLGSNRNVFMSFPIDAGFSYLTKIYHPINNPENLFFGSPISFYLSVGAQFNYKLSNTSLLQVGACYQHISNGGIKMPNKGMNFPSFSMGIVKYLSAPNWGRLEPISSLERQSSVFNLFVFGSFKTVPNINKLVPLGGAQIVFTKPINFWHHWVLGSELVFNTYKRDLFLQQNIQVTPWEQSLQTGYKLRVGKTSLLVLFGAELLNDKRSSNFIYQRYGLVQQLGRNMLLAATLKANGHVADIFDVRVGYRIIKK